MPSAVEVQKIRSRFLIEPNFHNPGATGAVIATPDTGTTLHVVDMKDYTSFGVMVTPAAVTGDVTLVEIVAATDAAMTTPVQVKTSATVALDIGGDYAYLECHADELPALGDGLRYVAARITNDNAANDQTVFYIAESKHPGDSLFAETVQA